MVAIAFSFLDKGITLQFKGGLRSGPPAATHRYPLTFLVDTACFNVYKYTSWIVEQLSRFSNKTAGTKWQKSAPILNFGIHTKMGGLPYHTPKRTYRLVL